MFHLFSIRNYRNPCVNGKQPLTTIISMLIGRNFIAALFDDITISVYFSLSKNSGKSGFTIDVIPMFITDRVDHSVYRAFLIILAETCELLYSTCSCPPTWIIKSMHITSYHTTSERSRINPRWRTANMFQSKYFKKHAR